MPNLFWSHFSAIPVSLFRINVFGHKLPLSAPFFLQILTNVLLTEYIHSAYTLPLRHLAHSHRCAQRCAGSTRYPVCYLIGAFKVGSTISTLPALHNLDTRIGKRASVANGIYLTRETLPASKRPESFPRSVSFSDSNSASTDRLF